MIRTMMVATAAAALLVPVSGNVASAHTYKRHFTHHRFMRDAPVGLYGDYGYGRGYRYGGYGYGATWNRTAGPPWSEPNQCWMDLGYGRYESCDQ